MDPVVLRTLLVVVGIAVVIAVGLWWKRRDGQVRTISSYSTNSASSSAVQSAASEPNVSGRDAAETDEGEGTEPTAAASAPAAAADTPDDSPRLTPVDLDAVGLELSDADAGAVLFGSPTCAPCANVKQILGDLAAEHAGFRWVYADAGDHLDLTRQHRIMRVPTVLMLSPSGDVVARASGVPKIDDLRQVLGA